MWKYIIGAAIIVVVAVYFFVTVRSYEADIREIEIERDRFIDEAGVRTYQVDSLTVTIARISGELSHKDSLFTALGIELGDVERKHIRELSRLRIQIDTLKASGQAEPADVDIGDVGITTFDPFLDFGSGFVAQGWFDTRGRYEYALVVPPIELSSALIETETGFTKKYLKITPDVFEVLEWDIKVERMKRPEVKRRFVRPFVGIGYSWHDGPALTGGVMLRDRVLAGGYFEEKSISVFGAWMF